VRRIGVFLALVAASIAGLLVLRPSSATRHSERTQEAPETDEGASHRESEPPAAAGIVLDAETKEPVSHARVTLFALPDDLPAGEATATFVADDAGRFSVPLPQESACGLVIEADGYPPQACRLDPAGMTIPLDRGEDKTLAIIDDEGKRVDAAELDVFPYGGPMLRLQRIASDAAGAVTVRLSDGQFLLVRSSGYAYEEATGEEDVVLQPGFTIGGRIVDSSGQPVPGASVHLLQQGSWSRPLDYRPTLISREEGDFLFRGIHDVECRLVVTAGGYFEKQATAAPGDTGVRVVLRRAASASGVVATPDGSPARGASVRLDRSYFREWAETDAEGRFDLTGLEARRQELHASLGDGLEAVAEIAPAEGEAVTGLRLALRPPRKVQSFVRVQVVDRRGQAVVDASVSWMRFFDTNLWDSVGTVSTDRSGMAVLAVTEPSGTTAMIRVSPPQEDEALWRKQCRPGWCGTTVEAVTSAAAVDAPVLDVVLNDPMQVGLDVRAPDGKPLVDATVELAGRDAIEAADIRVPDPRGAWYVDPDVTYSVRVFAPGFLTLTMPRWSPRDRCGMISATLRYPAAVRGWAVDSRGAPLDEVYVTVDAGLDGLGIGQSVPCRPDGSFQLEGLNEGTGMLTLGRARGAPEAAAEIRTACGHATDVGCLTLVPQAALRGRVIDSAARPLGGARIDMETGLPEGDTGTYSHADGTFRVMAPSFAPGHLLIGRHGFGKVRLTFPAGAHAIPDVVMPAPGSLDVEVTGDDQGYVTVDVSWPTEPHGPAGGGVYRLSDAQPYRIDDLAPGRYLVRLSFRAITLQDEVEIVAGETAKVTFRLR